MNDSIITIMGATGNTGRAIANGLLASGKRVRAIGRNPDKLAELAALGAEIRTGDVADPAFLTA
ncbi:MAG: NAD(P)H-binding protein, partial [Deltaproteobacteria bacterium]|nr:NAD(P)H-binding protein [Nannocystaceae bacterium]